MKKLLAFLLLLPLLLIGEARAQSAFGPLGPPGPGPMWWPGWTQGTVPTVQQWDTLLTNKLDFYSTGLPIAYGGTGATTAAGALANLGITSTPGTVTSVALQLPSSIFSVGGSPVTTTGSLIGTLTNQSANKVWAGPTTGSAAAPTFRSLVAADIPSLSGTYLPLAGGTMTGSLTAQDGSVLGATGVALGLNGSASTPSLGRGNSGWFFSGAGGAIETTVGGTLFGYADANNNFFWSSTTADVLANPYTGSNSNVQGFRAGHGLTSGSLIARGYEAGRQITALGPNDTNQPVLDGFQAGKYSSDGGNVATGPLAFASSLSTASSSAAYSDSAYGEMVLAYANLEQKSSGFGSGSLTYLSFGGQMTGTGRGSCGRFIGGSYVFCASHAGGVNFVYSMNSNFVGESTGGLTSDALFQATATGSTLTVTSAPSDGPLVAGQAVLETSGNQWIPVPTTILAFGTGGTTGTGGTGTYALSGAVTTISTPITMASGYYGIHNQLYGAQLSVTNFGDHDVVMLGYNITTNCVTCTAIGSGQAASYISGNFAYGGTTTAIAASTAQTYTAAQVMGGTINRTSNSTVSDVLPTAAQMVSSTGIPAAEVGSVKDVWIQNSGSATITITTTDANTTLSGNVTVPGTSTSGAVQAKLFRFRITAVGATPTMTVQGMEPAFMPLAGGTFSGAVTGADGTIWNAGGSSFGFTFGTTSPVLKWTNASISSQSGNVYINGASGTGSGSLLTTNLTVESMTFSGLTVNSSAGALSTVSSVAAATVAASFIADHRVAVNFAGTTYYIAVSSTPW